MKKTLFPFGSSSRNSGRAMRATSLRLENLEDRQLLSVTDLVPLAAAASESAVETAPAAEDVAIDLSSVAEQTETAYNEHDLAAVESLGMTADDSNVVWNAEGRVTSIVSIGRELSASGWNRLRVALDSSLAQTDAPSRRRWPLFLFAGVALLAANAWCFVKYYDQLCEAAAFYLSV